MTTDLFLEGKKFISVNRASKEIGYSQDYIGQLCRSGKIPAKLVGRTWFVDFDFLRNYKARTLQQDTKPNPKPPNNVDSKEFLVLPRTVIHSEPIRYESEPSSVLPSLAKKYPIAKKNEWNRNGLVNHPLILHTSFVISLFVIANVVFSWLAFFSPRQTEIFNDRVASAYNSIVRAVDGLGEGIDIAQVLGTSTGDSLPDTNEGIVVFPDSENRENLITKIKNAFSDDVEILFDDGGESGVIRPVFKSGTDDDYAFVLVPIEDKK